MYNRLIERLWTSLKSEDVNLPPSEDALKPRPVPGRWIVKYNQHRTHQALGSATPKEDYRAPESHSTNPVFWA